MQATEAEALFVEHKPRALALVNAYCRTISPTLNYIKDDIDSEALIGLWQACLRFEKTDNNTFWTFAYLRVKGSILDFLRREKIQVPAAQIATQVKIVPLWDEDQEPHSVGRFTADDFNRPAVVKHGETADLEDQRSRHEVISIEQAIQITSTLTSHGFSQQAVDVVQQYYCMGKTMPEIVADNGVSLNYASQTIHKGVERLRAAYGA